jgi:hypothetical protein
MIQSMALIQGFGEPGPKSRIFELDKFKHWTSVQVLDAENDLSQKRWSDHNCETPSRGGVAEKGTHRQAF